MFNIKLKALEDEYDNLLKEHEQLFKTHIQNLIHQKTSKNKEFDIFPENSYWGTHSINKFENIKDDSECEIKCASDDKCTGATFNSKNNTCWTRSGISNKVSGSKEDVAIISKVVDTDRQLNELNKKIRNVENEIRMLRNKSIRERIMITNRIDQSNDKINNYDKLIEKEKTELMEAEQKFGTLEQSNKDNILYANKQYLVLSLWFILSAILIIIVIVQFTKIPIYGNTLNTAIYFSLIVIVIIGIFIIMRKVKK